MSKTQIMRTIFLFALSLSVFFAHAQKDKIKPEPPEEFVTIEMSKFPIADIPRNSIPVADIRIVQVLKDSMRLGYTVKGMGASVATLRVTEPLTEILQRQVKRMYKHDYEKNGVEIFWLVKWLRFGAKSDALSYSYANLCADAYISRTPGLFTKVCTVDTVLMSTETGGFGNDAENALRVLLKMTLLAEKNAAGQQAEGISIDRIIREAKEQPEAPVLTAAGYKEGAYLSFDEFLQNNPSLINYESFVVKKKKIGFVKNGENGQKDTIQIWGLCKAGEIYKYHNESLIPIEKQGAHFIISDYVQKTNKRNQNLFLIGLASGITGGLAGGLIAGTAVGLISSSANNRQILVTTIPHITKPGKQPIGTCINMKDGEFTF